jgi:hypothetical protein
MVRRTINEETAAVSHILSNSSLSIFLIFLYLKIAMALLLLVCYTPWLFVATNPVLYYFISMLCVLSCARVVNTGRCEVSSDNDNAIIGNINQIIDMNFILQF